jgi:hypothetical protein
MKRIALLLIFLFFAAPKAGAQTQIQSFAADPATCDPTRGLQYYNVPTKTMKFCSALNVWSPINSAPGAGTNQLGATFNVKSMIPPAIGDAKKTITAVTSNGSASVTDATNTPWLVSDVGKNIYCTNVVGGTNFVSLNLTIAKIATFVNPGSITVNTTGNGNAGGSAICVWFTQKETTSFLAANTLAIQALTGVAPYLGPALAYPSNVYCPGGGYVVDGPFFIQVSAANNTLGAGFLGNGRSSCVIYISPDVTVSNTSWILNSTQNTGTTFADFTVDCSLQNLSVAAPGMRFNAFGNSTLRNIEIDGCGTTGDNNGLIQITGGANVIIDGLIINNAPLNSAEPPLSISGSAGITVRNMRTTNPGPVPTQVSNSGSTSSPSAGGPRQLTGIGVTFESSIFDEGATPGAIALTASSVNFISDVILDGLNTALSVDANSSAYLDLVTLGPFAGGCSGGSRQAVTIATTGYVYATGSDFEGCGSDGTGLSAAVKGTSSGTFVSAGGNTWRNCSGTLPCPLVTVANYGTQAFNGGIVPKSSETHTPNTCYALTGTLVATQNLCTFLNDQNYQVINITAQSGGNAPANSSCATPPVITLSDGTRSATLTLTSGKTQWSSAVDSSTVNSIFAGGTTLTISVGTFTCVTPPSTLGVSYVLQSVLNP